jgi:hypothetical protein
MHRQPNRWFQRIGSRTKVQYRKSSLAILQGIHAAIGAPRGLSKPFSMISLIISNACQFTGSMQQAADACRGKGTEQRQFQRARGIQGKTTVARCRAIS